MDPNQREMLAAMNENIDCARTSLTCSIPGDTKAAITYLERALEWLKAIDKSEQRGPIHVVSERYRANGRPRWLDGWV